MDGDGYKCNITYGDGDGDIDGAGDSACSNSLVTDDMNSHGNQLRRLVEVEVGKQSQICLELKSSHIAVCKY